MGVLFFSLIYPHFENFSSEMGKVKGEVLQVLILRRMKKSSKGYSSNIFTFLVEVPFHKN